MDQRNGQTLSKSKANLAFYTTGEGYNNINPPRFAPRMSEAVKFLSRKILNRVVPQKLISATHILMTK